MLEKEKERESVIILIKSNIVLKLVIIRRWQLSSVDLNPTIVYGTLKIRNTHLENIEQLSLLIGRLFLMMELLCSCCIVHLDYQHFFFKRLELFSEIKKIKICRRNQERESEFLHT
jgi:hypothetical protein